MIVLMMVVNDDVGVGDVGMVRKKKEKETSSTVVVDLDGTLVKTDTLIELLLRRAREDLFVCCRVWWWLRKGRANLKRELIKRASINVETLPYRKAVVDYLQEIKAAGHKVVLATASDIELARRVVDYLKVFDEVIGSDGVTNMSGEEKARALVAKFGRRKYEYIGNSRSDLPVWKFAKVAHVVSNSGRLLKRVQKETKVGMYWLSWYVSFSTVMRALRPHQWVKNLLVFVPMLADHQLGLGMIGRTGLAFVIFSMTASSVYVINDLLDLESDRRHAEKKKRPFASGDLPVWVGFIIVPVFIGVAGALAAWLSPMFIAILLCYFVLNLLYSFGAKQIVLLDVIILAVLYSLRVLAGGEVVGITVSAWLMALTLFLALSGALMKRYVELSKNNQVLDHPGLVGRGYISSDITIVGQLGIISGYMSVLVLALYVNSSEVRELYRLPEYWWLVALLLLYAVSRGWVHAYRGKVEDDPIMHVLKDPINYWILGLTVFLALLAI
jgi:4-hydroxybenzoate polyprenyltransferase/phosphoglycolate phosphatase-like HAD superfamily hydrolase